MDFPLVQLREFEIERVWNNFHSLANTFAVNGQETIHMKGDRLAISHLQLASLQMPLILMPEDENGNALIPIEQRYADIAARGPWFCINTGEAIYKVEF